MTTAVLGAERDLSRSGVMGIGIEFGHHPVLGAGDHAVHRSG